MNKEGTERGSMTLEACMVVPMFIAVMLLVNGLFIFFIGQQVMTNALVQSAKSLSFDPYAVQRLKDADDTSFIAELISGAYDLLDVGGGDYVSSTNWYEDDDITKEVKQRFLLYLSPTKADEMLKTFGIKNGVAGLDFSESSITDGVLTIKVSYVQEFIFNAMDLASFDDSMQIQIKLFQNKDIES